MTRNFSLLTMVMLLLVFVVPAQAADETGQTKVMVVGTFHFAGSDGDKVSVTMGDMLGEERQAEIHEVVERLASFQPTRIMVEMPHDMQPRLDGMYAAWLAGQRELGASETEQLGMRLARKLGHGRIHAVDHRQPMDFERMMKAGAEAGQGQVLGWFQGAIAGVQSSLEDAQGPDKSLLDALRFHNGPWGMQGNGLYLKLAVLGTDEDPAGAEVVAAWYERNLKIYSNIARLVEGPEERVLVIFGSGHLPQLVGFFDENPDYEVVSALDVLGSE
jgi:hypothetical protein